MCQRFEKEQRKKIQRASEALLKTTSPYLRRDLTKYIARAERKMKGCNAMQRKS
nr:MAG TPA: Transcriptional regulator, RHH-like, CopG [Caudoviricetes sp.]